MHFVGGTECKPTGVPESDWYSSDGTFNYDAAYGHACAGQKDVSWRFPLGFQMVFAWILFVGVSSCSPSIFPVDSNGLLIQYRRRCSFCLPLPGGSP
jgi:hypothetical protein